MHPAIKIASESPLKEVTSHPYNWTGLFRLEEAAEEATTPC